jgi:tetraacyldisaccharide 4'-kinase
MKAVNWSAIHTTSENNLFTSFLRGLSFLYNLAIQLRLVAYKIGFLKVKNLPTHVISIGNITTGGTGKTPFVAMLAQWAETHGFKVAILSRGYKGKRSNDLVVVSDGKKVLASFDDAGDEPVMLAKTLSSVPVLISKKRYKIGSLALKLFNSELLLLDDGYQHISLHRDINILLVDAKRQFGNRSLLPLGPLREPINQIKRADIIIITKCTDTHSGENLVNYFQKNFPAKSIYRSRYFPYQVIFPLAGTTHSPNILKGKNVLVFAGIADPDDFLETVKNCGANIVRFQAFSDHHFFSKHEIEELLSWKKQSKLDFLLTTEKDWIRIDSKNDQELDIAILTIKAALLSDANTFFESIKQGIIRSNVKK